MKNNFSTTYQFLEPIFEKPQIKNFVTHSKTK